MYVYSIHIVAAWIEALASYKNISIDPTFYYCQPFKSRQTLSLTRNLCWDLLCKQCRKEECIVCSGPCCMAGIDLYMSARFYFWGAPWDIASNHATMLPCNHAVTQQGFAYFSAFIGSFSFPSWWSHANSSVLKVSVLHRFHELLLLTPLILLLTLLTPLILYPTQVTPLVLLLWE
jgi:hypothetical protein